MQRTRLFYLNSYYNRMSNKHSLIMNQMSYKSIYQDYSGSEVDIHSILDRRRFLNVFESPPNFELMDVIVEILEKKGVPYLYVNLNILPNLETRYRDKDEFWGVFAQSIIANLQKVHTNPNQNLVLLFDRLQNFYGTLTNEEQLAKWEYFAEIIDTIYRRLEYVSVIIVTESAEVTDYLEGRFC